MDLTANYSLGKPLGTEDYDIGVPNANMDIIDGLLKARADGETALDARVDVLEGGGGGDVDTRLDALEAKFTAAPAAPLTDLFTAATNFTINEQLAYVWGPLIIVYISFTRSGSTLTSGSDGNITNTNVASWAAGKDAYKPPASFEAGFAGTEAGPLWGGYITSSGIVINALLPGINLASGDNLRGTATFIRAMV